nr:sugar nucleotide-binding protein [Salinicola tamaricis]
MQPFGRGLVLGRQECDLAEPGAVAATVSRHAPGVVINATAYTAVDRAESEPALARRINTEAVAELAAVCAERISRWCTTPRIMFLPARATCPIDPTMRQRRHRSTARPSARVSWLSLGRAPRR